MIKEKLQKLVKRAYGECQSIDEIHEAKFIGCLCANIELWRIKFSYTTIADQYKESEVYITPSVGYENVEHEFWNLVNDKYVGKEMFNVKIMDINLHETFNVML